MAAHRPASARLATVAAAGRSAASYTTNRGTTPAQGEAAEGWGYRLGSLVPREGGALSDRSGQSEAADWE